jgi:hypothetical protein
VLRPSLFVCQGNTLFLLLVLRLREQMKKTTTTKRMFLQVAIVLIIPAVVSQTMISLYVNPVSSNATLPCGISSDAACPNLTAAYMSIPLLSKSKSDRVTIFLFPGVHNACDVSFYWLVSNVSVNTSSYLTLQSLNESLATLTCPSPIFTRILALDSDQMTLSLKKLAFQFTNSICFFKFNECC